MPKPLTLPRLDDTVLAQLRQHYDASTDANLRLRYQMVLLASQGRSVSEIASIVLRSHDTVTRVLNRFCNEGSTAIPRRKAPGGAPTVTIDWTSELLRVIELDPHTVGVSSANWTTGLLATYLADKTGVTVSAETVRIALHRHGYVCKRPTWTLKRKAEEQDGYVGNA
jgi:transposase